MISLEQAVKEVSLKLKDDPHRLAHVMGVYDVALKLANHYDVSKYDVGLAALFHDFMKNDSIDAQKKFLSASEINYYQEAPVMYHALSASHYLNQVHGIIHSDILDAIQFHVWGKKEMSMIGKIIFVSDYCEPNRDFTDVEMIYQTALSDLNQAVFYCMKITLEHVLENKQTPHADQVLAYQYYMEVTHAKTESNY
jgi:predicted HD superfamily hydrolase involved in NAD metabolism